MQNSRKLAEMMNVMESTLVPLKHILECYQLNSGMKALFIPVVNKVPGYWTQSKTDLANKPRNMQIFPHAKFGINRTAGSKIIAKKFLWPSLLLN